MRISVIGAFDGAARYPYALPRRSKRAPEGAPAQGWVSVLSIGRPSFHAKSGSSGVRIGEISLELEKGTGRPRKEILITDDKNLTKAEQLADAGISTKTAHRYEELAGGRKEQSCPALCARRSRESFRKRQQAGTFVSSLIRGPCCQLIASFPTIRKPASRAI